MDAVKFLKEVRRMCKSIGCCDCPLNEGQGHCQVSYHAEAFANAVNAVEQWSSEHPVKTRLMDFLDKFPDVELGCDGYPIIFPSSLGYCGKGVKCRDCEYHGIRRAKECWDMPLDE